KSVFRRGGAPLPYRILLDQMYAGAVTLTLDGIIVYCNTRFADIFRTPLARVIGSAPARCLPRRAATGRGLGGFGPPTGQPPLGALLERASGERIGGELAGRAGDGTPVPI